MLLPKPAILDTSKLLFESLGHRFGDLGSRGTPNGHTEAQMYVFIDFLLTLGSNSGPTLNTFSRFSVIWDDRKENSFQVHDFGGPGMEIIVECSGCMCHNHVKPRVLSDFIFLIYLVV